MSSTPLHPTFHSMSEAATLNNIRHVQNMIDKKNSPCPYLATSNQAKNVTSDVDHWPYTRFYRGSYTSDRPIIYEREAGYRYVNNDCYRKSCYFPPQPEVDICFQAACTTDRRYQMVCDKCTANDLSVYDQLANY